MIDPTLVPALQDVAFVARTGSVGAAARQLHKTPSAVSQQLRRVEEHFGVQLFERAGRGMRLCPSGEAALFAINRMFDEAEALFGYLGELAGTTVTTLRVAASDYLGKGLLLPVLQDLSAKKAALRFEITTMHSLDASRAVARREVDFAVITTLETKEGMVERLLCTQPFRWVGPRQKRHRAALVSRIEREPLLRLASGSQGRRLLDAFLEEHRVRPTSTIDVPSVSLLLSYASGGLGVGLVPALALADVAASRVVTEPAAVQALPVKLVYRDNHRLTAGATLFVEGVVRAGRLAANWLHTRRWAA
jgi:DNA-binding transcriptional LysR family regulator